MKVNDFRYWLINELNVFCVKVILSVSVLILLVRYLLTIEVPKVNDSRLIIFNFRVVFFSMGRTLLLLSQYFSSNTQEGVCATT